MKTPFEVAKAVPVAHLAHCKDKDCESPAMKKRALSFSSSVETEGSRQLEDNDGLVSDTDSYPGDRYSDSSTCSWGVADLELLHVVGRGTFASQVALARHTHTHRLCVIKTLPKATLVRRNQVQHTITEKRVLSDTCASCPFIVQLLGAQQTADELHFVLEFCAGGELFYHLQQQADQKFSEHATRFYTAEVLSALVELHDRNVIYRDLKPENVLLDGSGHVKLVDFGFARILSGKSERTYSFCGSPEYLSPEMVRKSGHSLSTDMWSFGCFLYELLTGNPPFQSNDMSRLFAKIEKANVWYPPELSNHAVNLLTKCLEPDVSRRISAREAMEHPFFDAVDWRKVHGRQMEPPVRPYEDGENHVINFDDEFTKERVAPLRLTSPRGNQDDAFEGF